MKKSKKILSGNKLIAEFMGHKFWMMDKRLSPYPGELCCNIPEHFGDHDYGNDLFFVTQLKYHMSWNWLMPVIKKCWNIDCEECINIFEIYSFLGNNIQALWHNVIYFIEWNNERTKDEIL